jgi:hypothetical protein
MTVRELRNLLAQYPDDMLVVTPGFDEGGYDDVETVEPISLALNVRDYGHCGRHNESPSGTPALLINF